MGSVVGEVDVTGALPATKQFDVYGATRAIGGTPTTRQGFVGGLGHETDDETGLVYMRARYYDPSCGRFISQDPKLSGANWFAYCGSEPVDKVDRSGKCVLALIGSVESVEAEGKEAGEVLGIGVGLINALSVIVGGYLLKEAAEAIDPEAEGKLLGVEEDDEGRIIYWWDFGGVHIGFGSEKGDAQGSDSDGDDTYGGLQNYHRGGVIYGDTDSPYDH